MTRKDIKFFVKPEERIIVGVYEEDEDIFMKEVYDKFPGWTLDVIEAMISSDRFPTYPNVIRATAVCSEDDEWNEEIGKKVVEAKINLKRHNRVCNMVVFIGSALNDIALRLVHDIYNEHNRKAEAIEHDLDTYFNNGKAGENV